MDYDNFVIRTLIYGAANMIMDDFGYLVYLWDMPYGYGFVTSLQMY